MSEEFKEAEGWKPTAGDVVTGKLQDVVMVEGGYGAYPMLVLERSDGSEVNVHAFHDVLRNELVRKRPQPGDELTIKYLGKVDKGGKNGYHSYRVRGGQAQVNWGAFGDDAPGESDVPIASAGLPTPPPAPVTVPDDNEPLPF